MKKFIAMRHGESEANVRRIFSSEREKYPLTDAGKDQVKRAALQLSGLGIEAIVCSPVLRTRQTAEIVAEILGVECNVDERVRETDLQSLDGKPLREMSAFDRKKFGIETWESHVERMMGCVSGHEGTCLIVSHALPIRTLICSYLDIYDEDSCSGIEIGYATFSGVVCNSSKVLSIGSKYISESFRKAFLES